MQLIPLCVCVCNFTKAMYRLTPAFEGQVGAPLKVGAVHCSASKAQNDLSRSVAPIFRDKNVRL